MHSTCKCKTVDSPIKIQVACLVYIPKLARKVPRYFPKVLQQSAVTGGSSGACHTLFQVVSGCFDCNTVQYTCVHLSQVAKIDLRQFQILSGGVAVTLPQFCANNNIATGGGFSTHIGAFLLLLGPGLY